MVLLSLRAWIGRWPLPNGGRCVTVSIKISELEIGLGRCGGVVTSVPRTAVDTLDQAAIRVPSKRA